MAIPPFHSLPPSDMVCDAVFLSINYPTNTKLPTCQVPGGSREHNGYLPALGEFIIGEDAFVDKKSSVSVVHLGSVLSGKGTCAVLAYMM